MMPLTVDPFLALRSRIAISQREQRHALDTDDLLARIRADLHPKQQEVFDDITTREIGVVAGYGSGKTWIASAKAVQLAILNPRRIGAVLEPTGPMIEDIWVTKFEDFLERYQISYTYRVPKGQPEHILHLPQGDTKIVARSLENYRRIVGPDWAWAICDEVDTIKEKLAQKANKKIIGRLRVGTTRQYINVSTPEGYGWHYKRYGAEGVLGPKRRLVRMRTQDNPNLDEDYIDSLRTDYSGPMLQAYMDGQYVNLVAGQVYDRFRRDLHVQPLPALLDRFGNPRTDQGSRWPHPDESIMVGIDFNIGNCNAVLAVKRDRIIWCFDEVVAAHDTDALAKEVRRRFPEARLLGYPDASGIKRTTNSTRSDIAILGDYGIENMSPAANPPVRDRVAVVQAALENGKGETRLFIDPRCKRLVECLEMQSYNDKGEPDKGNGHDHHCFVAGTMVRTMTGAMAIECLPPSGLIMGPWGAPIRYRNARRTGTGRPTVRVLICTGDVVECTPEHRWITAAGEWIPASQLTPGTQLLCPPSFTPKSRFSKARLTTFAASTFSAMASACIGLCGRPAMARSLLAITSIMWTATAPTTTRPTWSLSRLLSTVLTMRQRTAKQHQLDGIQALGSGCLQPLLNGMAQTLATNGTGSTTSERATTCTNVVGGSSNARTVLESLRPSTIVEDSAQRIARPQNGGLQVSTMSCASASLVASSSPSTVTRESCAALGRAAQSSRISVVNVSEGTTADVYCLTSDAGAFVLGSGAIVSNCDALGYVVHRVMDAGRGGWGKAVRAIRSY